MNMGDIPIYQCKIQQIGTLSLSNDRIYKIGDAAEIIVPLLKNLDREHLIALYIGSPNKIIGIETIAIGSSESATTSMRETLRGAVILGAMAILVAHNHPHGNLEPSEPDIEFTKTLQRSANIFGIQLLGSLIINTKGEFRDIMSLPEKVEVTLQEQMKEKFAESSSPDYMTFFLKAMLNIAVSGFLVHLMALLIKMVADEVQSIQEINVTVLAVILFCIFFLYKGIMRTMTLPVIRRWPKVKPTKPRQTNDIIER